jgi:hypothetical protein
MILNIFKGLESLYLGPVQIKNLTLRMEIKIKKNVKAFGKPFLFGSVFFWAPLAISSFKLIFMKKAIYLFCNKKKSGSRTRAVIDNNILRD